MTAIMLTPVIIILAFLIIFLVYLNIYKRRINRSLEKNESTAHVAMVPTESIGKVLVIIGAIIFTFSILNQLSNIAFDVRQTNIELKAEISNLNGQINALKSELQAQLEQQNSILNSFEYSLGKINSKKNTVETTFRCVPKEVSKDTVVQVIFGKETITLEAGEGGIFTATKQLPLFVDMEKDGITIAVTTEGKMNTQVINDEFCEFYGALCNECLPQLAYIAILSEEFENKKFHISGEYDRTVEDEGITDVKLFFIIDDTVVKTLDITEQITDIDETYEVDSNSLFEIVAEGKDSYGYTHRKVLYAMSQNMEYEYEDSEYDTILDKDGNVLYQRNDVQEDY